MYVVNILIQSDFSKPAIQLQRHPSGPALYRDNDRLCLIIGTGWALGGLVDGSLFHPGIPHGRPRIIECHYSEVLSLRRANLIAC
jgi:hypothetical protein